MEIKMENSKQVRVDNWGTFFLQRLQTFFNKTDYCDLTLQFEGNVQLKVHRLVMNACTDYFQVLEQTCEMIEDILIMPSDLQADVILPIVNFMYTGMLEFQMNMYERLYKTAELMDIPVLTKILDAQKNKIPALNKPVKKNVPPQQMLSVQNKKMSPKTELELPSPLPGRKLPVWKRKCVPVPMINTVSSFYSEPKRPLPDPLSTYDNTPKPTRFEWPEDELSNYPLLESSFDDISYTSKQLLTQEEEIRSTSSTFDEVKHLPNLNKRPANYNDSQIDIEEVKNYVKEQKIRSDLADYDDDEDNDLNSLSEADRLDSAKRKQERQSPRSAKRLRFNLNEKENKETKVNVTPTSRTEVNHTKIISEVLKKYPHLVKKNKNIRLKILAKSPTKDLPKTTPVKPSTSKVGVVSTKKDYCKSTKTQSEPKNFQDEGPWTCYSCSTSSEKVEFVLYYLYRKHMTDVHNEKFDSRLCKFCGHKSTKHNMLMYHQYTKHGIKPPAAYNFPKCNQCPYIAITESLLIKHKQNHSKFDLQCQECKVAFNNQHSLTTHVQITGHTGKSGKMNFDCQYCTKRCNLAAELFSHIKMQHRKEGRRDGIVSIDELEEDELDEMEDEKEMQGKTIKKEKINILSDVKVPLNEQAQMQEGISLESNEALNNVASGIATSLGLVDIVVLDDNQQYILQSNNQQLVTQENMPGNQQQEFILPDLTDSHSFTQNQSMGEVITPDHNVITQTMLSNSDIASTDELVMVLTDHDYNDGNNEILNNDNSNIVVLYSHPVEGHENQFITSQGNLMLNSQTGMIELRNPAAVTSTTGEPILAQDNTHIESIEMIQREINSHKDFKIETSYEGDKTNSSSNSLSIMDTLNQHGEMLESKPSMPELIENNTNKLVMEEDVVINSPDDLVFPEQQQISSANNNENAENPIIVDLDEEEEEVVVNQAEEKAVEETEEQAVAEEVPETLESETKTEESVAIEMESGKTSENVETEEETDSKENEIVDAAVIAETEAMDVDDANESAPNVTEEKESVTEVAMQIDKDEIVETKQNEDTQEEEEQKEAKSPENDLTQEEIKEEEPQSIPEIASESKENEEVSDVEEDSVTEELQLELSGNEAATENEQQSATKETTPPPLSPKVNNEETSHPEENKEETPLAEENKEETPLPEENNEETPLPEENKEETPLPDETKQNSPETSDENKAKEIGDEPTEKCETDEEKTEPEEENASDDPVDVRQEIETLQEDFSQPPDESSRASENTQTSNSDKPNNQETNQSAKISILDDWEDTDSQQSEHLEAKTAENTVHKLINDWEEDDDETKD